VQDSSQIVTTNKPTPDFLHAGSPSCHQTNSVKALKEKLNVCMFIPIISAKEVMFFCLCCVVVIRITQKVVVKFRLIFLERWHVPQATAGEIFVGDLEQGAYTECFKSNFYHREMGQFCRFC